MLKKLKITLPIWPIEVVKNDWLISANKRRLNIFYWLNPANLLDVIVCWDGIIIGAAELYSAINRQSSGVNVRTAS